MKSSQIELAFAIFVIIASVAAFVGVVNAPLPAIAKFIVAISVLALCGYSLMLVFRLEGWYGLIMIRSKRGLYLLDVIAEKWPDFWQTFAEIGMVVGYGAFAYFLMKRRKFSWKHLFTVYGTGIVLLVILTSIVAPLAIGALFSMLSGGAEFAGASTKLSASVAQVSFVKYALLALMLLGGIASLTMASIFIFALTVIGSVIGVHLGSGQQLSDITPGGTPIIPGINLDLVQGVIALAVVLVVHEGLHGVIARLYKLPIKSAGLVFFGFLPFGAFVDIDEKVLLKEKKEKQNAVFVAGTAANFATSLVFLALFFALAFSTSGLRVSGIFVESGNLPQGAEILAINNTPIESFEGANLSANSTYSIETSRGTFERTTDANGKIGITYSLEKYAEGFGWVGWLLRLIALIFALNYIVAAINLVALPLFDGYYLMKNGVNNKVVEAIIMYSIVLAFALNFLPWLFR